MGAHVVREAKDQFYGERSGTIRDPFGIQSIIRHEIENVTTLEMQRRYDDILRGNAGSGGSETQTVTKNAE